MDPMLRRILLLPLLSAHGLTAPWQISAEPPDLSKEIEGLSRELEREAGDTPYIVIDRVSNRFQIRRRGNLILEAVCATGSGRILYGPKGKLWSFETPKRVFSIQRKVIDPVWAKPEWAFVETGEKHPVLPWAFRRLDVTTLGDYALELGDGFEIHGTLYPNLLGRHITHGCIRLNDEDLEAAYSSTEEGLPVYVY